MNFYPINSTFFIPFSGNKTTAEVTCFTDRKFHHNEKGFSHVEDFLSCKNPIRSSVVKTNDKSFSYDVGFKFGNESKEWIRLYRVDYNEKEKRAVKSWHELQINGKFNGTITDKLEMRFDESSMSKSDFDDYYKNLNEKLAESSNGKSIVYDFLVPPEDMVVPSWQPPTYQYVNSFPIYDTVKEGNWKIVKELVRSKAQSIRKPINIFTGIYGEL